jgi:hypothetical protein
MPPQSRSCNALPPQPAVRLPRSCRVLLPAGGAGADAAQLHEALYRLGSVGQDTCLCLWDLVVEEEQQQQEQQDPVVAAAGGAVSPSPAGRAGSQQCTVTPGVPGGGAGGGGGGLKCGGGAHAHGHRPLVPVPILGCRMRGGSCTQPAAAPATFAELLGAGSQYGGPPQHHDRPMGALWHTAPQVPPPAACIIGAGVSQASRKCTFQLSTAARAWRRHNTLAAIHAVRLWMRTSCCSSSSNSHPHRSSSSSST